MNYGAKWSASTVALGRFVSRQQHNAELRCSSLVGKGWRMEDDKPTPKECRQCGLLLLSGAIFDTAAQRDIYGPILGVHKDADPITAKAGIIGMGSREEWFATNPEFYACPRCGTISTDLT